MQTLLRRVLRPVFVLAALASADVARAGDLLKSVRADDMDDHIQINIDVGAPVNYIKHFPTRRGKILQIQVSLEGVSEDKLKVRESLEPGGDSILQDVIYEGNVRGGPFIVLRFNRIVGFSIGSSDNPNALLIEVEKGSSAVAQPATIPLDRPGDDKVAELMREARAALTRGENDKAVLLFSDLVRLQNHEFIEDAKEYLGVARERSGQLELAKKEYEDYLQKYPKGTRVDTVRQRLMALNTRLAREQEPLREGKRQRAARTGIGPGGMQTFGRVSSVYYNGWNALENSSITRSRNLWMSFLDVTGRKRDPGQETRVVFSGSQEWNMMNTKADEEDLRWRVRSAFFDYKGVANGFTASLGRQSAATGGVLGRFDGATFGYKLQPKLQFNGVVGMPVDYADPNRIQTNKPMVGGRLDFLGIVPNWNMSSYLIRQQVDGITERAAVGGDVRYFRDRNSFFSTVDYDVSYRILNMFTAHGGWQYDAATNISIHADFRRSPITLTSNALLGIPNIADSQGAVLGVTKDQLLALQNDLSIRKMLEYMPEEAIRNRALANTGRATLLTVGVIRDLTKDLQFNGNVTVSRSTSISPALTTQDVTEPTTESEFHNSDVSVTGQLIAREYFLPGDVLLGGLRISDTSAYKKISVNIAERAPMWPQWRGDARVRLDYSRDDTGRGFNTIMLAPAFKAEYLWRKDLVFEGEVGIDIVGSSQTNNDNIWSYVNLGGRYNF